MLYDITYLYSILHSMPASARVRKNTDLELSEVLAPVEYHHQTARLRAECEVRFGVGTRVEAQICVTLILHETLRLPHYF